MVLTDAQLAQGEAVATAVAALKMAGIDAILFDQAPAPAAARPKVALRQSA